MGNPLATEVAEELSKCFLSQNTYGRNAEDIPRLAALLFEDIPERLHKHLPAALRLWRRQAREFPTPADLLNLLEPKPKFDVAYAANLMRRMEKGEQLKYGEREYLQGFRGQKEREASITSFEQMVEQTCGEEAARIVNPRVYALTDSGNFDQKRPNFGQSAPRISQPTPRQQLAAGGALK